MKRYYNTIGINGIAKLFYMNSVCLRKIESCDNIIMG